MPIPYYGAEFWGHEKAAQLESVKIGYFKRLFGLHRTAHFRFLNVVLGIRLLKNYRLVSMIKFGLRVVQLPGDRLLKVAYEDLPSQGKKIIVTKNKRQFRQNRLLFCLE